MNRTEHVEWAKQRALKELDAGSRNNAIASITSDLTKHVDTQGHPAIELMVMLIMNGHMNSDREVREFIEGIR